MTEEPSTAGSEEERFSHLQRSKTKAAAGTVKNLLTKFSKPNNLPLVGEVSEEDEILPASSSEEPQTESVRRSNQSSKYQSRASIKAAPGTVRNLRANFEKE